MNNNSTHKGKRIYRKCSAGLCRPAVLICAALLSVFVNASAQNTDLPNPTPNIQTAPAGSFIIAMDNTNQVNPGYFNLKAYGLAVTLMDYGRRLRWVITAGKAKDGTDISVNAEKILPVYAAATVMNFKGGPFIVFAEDTPGVRTVVNNFNNSQPANKRVNIYRTTTSTPVDIRYDMNGIRPKAGILDDGGNANIHVTYMENAAIPTVNYAVLSSATGLSAGCYTFTSEAHNSTLGAFIDSIKNFVTLGGNFLAECHAITAYENWVNGKFQSTTGLNNSNNNLSNNVAYPNADLSFSQFEGYYNANQGGNTQTWTFPSGSVPQNNFFAVINGSTPALANSYGASGAKLRSGNGGMIYFLGNHNLDGTKTEDLNGQRMYLNAFLTPAVTPSCPGSNIPLLAIKLNYFTAKKINAQQVQLNWSTFVEQDSKEFIIERSADGVNFSAVTKINANGNSSIEVKYTTADYSPLSGKNFYRLIETGLNGNKTYSETIMVNMNTVNSSMDIYPNPAYGQVSVNLNDLPVFNNTISVLDLSGKMMISKTQLNGNAIKLNIQNLNPGTYIVKLVTTDGRTLQNKMIVVDHK